jgi:hypothetical protein
VLSNRPGTAEPTSTSAIAREIVGDGGTAARGPRPASDPMVPSALAGTAGTDGSPDTLSHGPGTGRHTPHSPLPRGQVHLI